MLLVFLILHLTVTVLANPFHKYPYVFLLDVGNEEIEKVNTEQIRLSIPGGSLAVKYPATGEGDLIGHVRVSGVDFGTDLKASIVQGGPGYKYVVLVFMGNPNVAYDAVVTIQTVRNIDDTNKIENMDEEDELNSSAEENEIGNPNVHSENENVETMQSSSNVYRYSNEEFNIRRNDYDTENANNDNENSINDQSVLQEGDEVNDDNSDQTAIISENTIDSSEDIHKYSFNNNQYGKYEAFRPVIIGGVRFYPQAALYTQDYNDERSVYDQENHADDNGNDRQHKDSNNNIAEDGSSAEY